MRVIHVLSAVMVVFSAIAPPARLAADQNAAPNRLTEAEFHRLQKLLRPDDEQLWRSIPWKISVLDAQRVAAKENKPIFIWAMDGHPLGCT
jgi:hypothetical protein